MGFTETLTFYTFIGAAIAVAVYLADGRRTGFVCATSILFWPLYLPLLLSKRAAEDDTPERTSTPELDEMAAAIAQVESELDARYRASTAGQRTPWHAKETASRNFVTLWEPRRHAFERWIIYLAAPNRRKSIRIRGPKPTARSRTVHGNGGTRANRLARITSLAWLKCAVKHMPISWQP